jgi:uncharacterized membrane protein YjgN (DUF898 family)
MEVRTKLAKDRERLSDPRLHGAIAGLVVLTIASLGLFYVWHAAREAQLDAVRTELQ